MSNPLINRILLKMVQILHSSQEREHYYKGILPDAVLE